MIKIELIDSMGSDLSTVNSARVSFGKCKDELDAGDKRLIRYLADHQHSTPFRHNQIQLRCAAMGMLYEYDEEDRKILFGLEKKPTEECKGRVYRCLVNEFINSNGEVVRSVRFKPLKRKSCKGCEKCGWLDEALQEQLSMGLGVGMDNPVHSNLYKLCMTDYSRDWETGYIDDYTIGFRRVEE